MGRDPGAFEKTARDNRFVQLCQYEKSAGALPFVVTGGVNRALKLARTGFRFQDADSLDP
jgi:hypothetical protein